MTVVIAAGGTGGHLYPAVALAREFLRQDPKTTVLFVGIALIVMCCTHNTVARTLSALVAVALVATVGFARVYRGLHFLTDVSVGVLLGLACLAVAAIAVRAASRQAARPRRTRAAEDGFHVESGDDARIETRLSTN